MSNLIKLLTEAQHEMGNPPMNGVGQIGQRKYNYALLADVEGVVKPPLEKRSIFLTQRIEQDNRLHTVAYLDDEVIELDSRPVLCDGDPRANGAAETYAKRYALCSVFGIVGEEDTDAEGITKPSTQPYDPIKEEKDLAATRMKEAVNAWCQKVGKDTKAELLAISKRNDFQQSASYYNKVAYEYEQKAAAK